MKNKTVLLVILLADAVIVEVVLLCVLLYPTLNKNLLVENNDVNEAKWQKKGSQNYVMRVDEIALTPTSGVSVLTVKNGVIESVVMEKPDHPEYQPSPEIYSNLTIDGLFQLAHWCATESPRVACTFAYDSEFGYPKHIVVNCPNPDTCQEDYTTIDVLDVRLLP